MIRFIKNKLEDRRRLRERLEKARWLFEHPDYAALEEVFGASARETLSPWYDAGVQLMDCVFETPRIGMRHVRPLTRSLLEESRRRYGTKFQFADDYDFGRPLLVELANNGDPEVWIDEEEPVRPALERLDNIRFSEVIRTTQDYRKCSST